MIQDTRAPRDVRSARASNGGRVEVLEGLEPAEGDTAALFQALGGSISPDATAQAASGTGAVHP
jgi:hypothetical protein